MKRNIKFLSGILVLLLALSGIFLFLNYITNPYNEKADRVIRGMYSEEAIFNDVDVALMGGSHGCNGFNPHEIYQNYGLTSYNYALSGAPIYINYYMMKEMYKVQKPHLVVLDLYYLGLKNENFSGDDYIFDIVRNMHYNKNRIDLIMKTSGSMGRKLRAFIPLIEYHSRFDELTIKDLLRKPEKENDSLLGSQYYFERNAGTTVSFSPWNNTKESGGINQRNKKYLQMIIDLVKENGSELLFVDIPHNHEDSGAPDEWADSEYMVMNEAREIASKNGIAFLQYDDNVLNQIGFVPEEDMYNKGHMNYWGSVKTSNYLGKYLVEHYQFDMSIKEKSTWDSYLTDYHKLVNESIK